jgi:nitroreductase
MTREGPLIPPARCAMSVFEAIYGLRATRRYQDRPVAPELVDQVLQAATMACSSGNTQPWEFVVVRDPRLRRSIQALMADALAGIDAERVQPPEQLVDRAGRSVTGHAAIASLDVVPVVVVVCWNPERGVRLRGEYVERPDGTLQESRRIPGGRGVSLFQACQNMMLAAHARGLSSLFTTFFFLREREIKALLGIPPRIFMECAVFLGYGAESLGPPRRRPITEVSHSNRWGERYRTADDGSG